MLITIDMLNDFFLENHWEIYASPVTREHSYKGVRLFYRDCRPDPDYLYITDFSSIRDVTVSGFCADLCLLCSPAEAKDFSYDDFPFVIGAPCSLSVFFSEIQEKTDELIHWDSQLTDILLNDGSLQDILDCSCRILKNPCFFLDANFQLIASCGEIKREENPFFYDTIKTGRTPTRFFEQLLALPLEERPPYFSRSSIRIAKHFSKYNELLASCKVNGVVALRFCMACTISKSEGNTDLVRHLMNRVKSSPGVRKQSLTQTNMSDCLFSRILENPPGQITPNMLASLGLQNYDSFAVIAMDFRTQIADIPFLKSHLEIMHPFIRFFTYREQNYALSGASCDGSDSGNNLNAAINLLLSQLDHMGVLYGISHTFSNLLSINTACAQALYALQFSSLAPKYNDVDWEDNTAAPKKIYSEAMLLHILETFFSKNDFKNYCPLNFRELLEDDKKGDGKNIQILYTWLANDCSATATSRLLHMHRNNILYRISRIENKYHFNFKNSTEKTLLFLLCYAVYYQLNKQ